LSDFGITPGQFRFIAENTGQKNNPVALPEKTLVEILQKRL